MIGKQNRLTDADRAALCARVDFLAVLRGAGVEVRRNGAAWLCRLREEKTPSCHVYPPGVGKKGHAGWTLHDYGDGWGGDALAYLVDKRGLPFAAAVDELCHLAGFTPESWQIHTPGCPRNDERPPPLIPTTPPPPLAAMPPEMQFNAALSFLLTLLALVPDAADKGEAYLAGRGCLPVGGAVGAWVLPAAARADLAAKLAAAPDAALLARAGLLYPAKGSRPAGLPFKRHDAPAGDVCLLGCYDHGGDLAYYVARRLDYEPGQGQKYLNQPCGGGAVRWPFNLPALYHAAGRLPAWPAKPAKDKAGDVLLVEGALDALGAACLGWPAVALLNRPQAHNYKDRDGAAARMLEAHLPALRDVRRVRVIPDADPGPKGAEGEALAARLAAWLTFAGVRAEVSTLAELCPDAPPKCKDLADVADVTRKDTAE